MGETWASLRAHHVLTINKKNHALHHPRPHHHRNRNRSYFCIWIYPYKNDSKKQLIKLNP